MMNSIIVARWVNASPLVKRVRKLARQSYSQQQPGSEQVISVDVRIRQPETESAYARRMGKDQIHNPARTVGQNLDCYI